MPDPDITTKESDDSARVKLWLDYLGKLKDREDRSQQVTGITTWVLVGLASALIIKGVPALPLLFASGSALTHAGVFYVFEMSFALFLFELNVVFLSSFRSRYSTVSLPPERLQPVIRSLTVVFFANALSLFVLGVSLLSAHLKLSRSVKIALIIFCSNQIMAHVALLLRGVATKRREAKFSLKLPDYGLSLVANRIRGTAVAVDLMFLGYSFFSGVAYARILHASGEDWLLPLAAASYAVLLLIILFSLIVRWIQRGISGPVYTALEQQILLEGLSSQEIKQRFVEHLFGPTVQQWFAEIAERMERGRRQGEDLLKEIEDGLGPLAAAPHTPETLEAVKKVFERTEKAQLAYLDELNAENILLDHALSLGMTREQAAAIADTIEKWKEQKTHNNAFRSRIAAIYNNFGLKLDEAMSDK